MIGRGVNERDAVIIFFIYLTIYLLTTVQTSVVVELALSRVNTWTL